MTHRGLSAIFTALLMAPLVVACTNDHEAPEATAAPDADAAAHVMEAEPRSLRQANVQAFDLENDIYILDVGSDDDVVEGDRFTVTPNGGEPFAVVVDKVFRNHASAFRHGSPADTHPRRTPPQGVPDIDGTVSEIEDDGARIVLSVGTSDGVTPDMEFTIYRDDQYVATVIVTDVRAHSCVTRVAEGMLKKAVQVGDKAATNL